VRYYFDVTSSSLMFVTSKDISHIASKHIPTSTTSKRLLDGVVFPNYDIAAGLTRSLDYPRYWPD
jgi:hypothetical protein